MLLISTRTHFYQLLERFVSDVLPKERNPYVPRVLALVACGPNVEFKKSLGGLQEAAKA